MIYFRSEVEPNHGSGPIVLIKQQQQESNKTHLLCRSSLSSPSTSLMTASGEYADMPSLLVSHFSAFATHLLITDKRLISILTLSLVDSDSSP